MAVEELSTFLADLEKYQILDASRLQEARSLGKGAGSAARSLAAELVRRGTLSTFQVDRLLDGNGESLVLGTYVLIELLGEGGMGQVFKARHALMDRVVALKLIRADRLGDPQAMGRFRREMQASAKLTHPNVVLAHDAARVGDVYLLVMEYVEGIDLSQYLRQRGPLPWVEAAGYVRQAALGLQHAHECGLVHRDIKPSNLILAARAGTIKLLDLGLARLRPHVEAGEAESQLTREGYLMGTPDYISPEQAVDSRTVDIRADIYSLGCTFYQLLAGRPPFPGGSLIEKLVKHQHAEPQPIEQLCPGIPPELAGIVRIMMAKRAVDRYEIPRAVANALAPFTSAASNVPTTSAVNPTADRSEISTLHNSVTPLLTTPPPLPGERKRKGPLKRRALLGLFVATPLLVLLFVYLLRTPTKDRQVADDTPPKSISSSTPTDPKDPTPKDVSQADVPTETAKLPDLPADGGPRLVKEMQGHTGSVLSLAFSPDSRRLASGSDDQRLRLWDARSGEATGKPLGLGTPVRALAWSFDSKRLASGGYDLGAEPVVKIWDVTGAEKHQILPWKQEPGAGSLAELRCLAFSRDGKHVAAGGGPLRIWDLAKNGEKPTVLPWQISSPTYSYGVAFSADGKTVALGCHEFDGDNVRVWDVANLGEPVLLRGNQRVGASLGHTDITAVVAFVAGGKRLVRVTSEGGSPNPAASVKVWDVGAGDRPFTLRETLKIPDGAVFALVSAADGHLRVGMAAGVEKFGFQPKAASGEVKIWDSVTQKVMTFETGHKEGIRSLAFSADGSRLATGGTDQTVRLWEIGR